MKEVNQIPLDERVYLRTQAAKQIRIDIGSQPIGRTTFAHYYTLHLAQRLFDATHQD
jgi:hypothetical protein